MNTICGIDCNGCDAKKICKGCTETDGRPLGGVCVAAECYKSGGEECFVTYKAQVIKEFNALGIKDMPQITELYQLSGMYVNLEYTLPNGQGVKFLDDSKIYLGCQVEKTNSDRCYGLVADDEYLLVSEYDCNGEQAEIVIFKKR